MSYIQYEMKYEIIYTEDCALIVSDEEIKPGDFNVPSDCNKSSDISRTSEEDLVVVNDKFNGYKKIIGHRPFTNAAILEGVPMLPEFSLEDDVEELAKDKFPYLGSEQVKSDQNRHTDTIRHGFKTGYNKAKETYNLTLNKLIDLYIEETGYGMDMWGKEENQTMSTIAKIIRSLQKPKHPKYFQIEMLCYVNPEFNEYTKTTTNSQGKKELAGEYIYE